MLQRSVDVLSHLFLTVPESDVSAVIGRDFFAEALSWRDTREISDMKVEMAKIPAYVLVLQLLFYSRLREAYPGLRELAPSTIQGIDEIIAMFRNASATTPWKCIFEYDMLALCKQASVTRECVTAVRSILQDAERSPVKNIPGELLGIAFQRLIPGALRKVIAAYYTTIPTSALLAALAIDSPEPIILDLACGGGNLLAAAYKHARALRGKASDHREPDNYAATLHEQVFGVDIMRFATLLTTITLALLEPGSCSSAFKIGIADATLLKPGDTIIPAIKPVEFLSASSPPSIVLPRAGIVIMNPPFTKNENMSKISVKGTGDKYIQKQHQDFTDYKLSLGERFAEFTEVVVSDGAQQKTINCIHKQMGLFAYFILLGDRFLEPNGKMALVLPSSFLRIKACENIRRYLSEYYTIDYIVSRIDRPHFSENTEFREILMVTTKHQPTAASRPCSYVVLAMLPNDLHEIEVLASSIHRGEPGPDIAGYTAVPQPVMKATVSNWFLPMASSNKRLMEIHKQVLQSDTITRYHNIVPKEGFIRGLDSTHKKELETCFIVDPVHDAGNVTWKYMCTSRDQIVFAMKNNESVPLKIDVINTRPGIKSTANLGRFEIGELHDYVIIDDFPAESGSQSGVQAWVKKVDDRTSRLFHIRRFDVTAPGTIHLGYYSIQPRAPTGLTWVIKGIDDQDAKIITLWHNSTFHLMQVFLNRKETRGGYMAVDEYNFEAYHVINIKKMKPAQIAEGLSIFEDLAKISFPGIFRQLLGLSRERMIIDMYFARILFPTLKRPHLFAVKLQTVMFEEIEMLKSLMNGDKRKNVDLNGDVRGSGTIDDD